MLCRLFIFNIILVLYLSTIGESKKKGKTIITEQITYDYDPEYFTHVTGNVKNANTTSSTIDYEIGLKFTVTRELIVRMHIIHRQPKKNVTIGRPMELVTCDYIQHDNVLQIYPSIRAKSNFPEKCPIKPGDLTLKDYDYDFNLPVFIPDGSFIFRIQGVSKGKVIQTFTWYGRIFK